jgi:hypothetical protein
MPDTPAFSPSSSSGGIRAISGVSLKTCQGGLEQNNYCQEYYP